MPGVPSIESRVAAPMNVTERTAEAISFGKAFRNKAKKNHRSYP